MQCGNAIPYPYSNYSSLPVCPEANPADSPWRGLECTCYADAFERCPSTTPSSKCPVNSTTHLFDSVRSECFSVMQPRWNAVLATCDSVGIGGPAPLGAACALNPFSAVDVRYMALYQLKEVSGSGVRDAGHRGGNGGAAGSGRRSGRGSTPAAAVPSAAPPSSAFAWVRQNSSSINTDASSRLANMTSWAQPSMGADWGTGYYPRNVLGAGPPAFMAVLSLDRAYNFAWYLLNQVALDRCPDCSKPNCRLQGGSEQGGIANCWGDPPGAESGELDLLETPFWSCKGFPELCDDRGYGRMYVTVSNSKGFCNPMLNGNYSEYGPAFGMGGHGTTNFFDAGDTASAPAAQGHLYAAVVDAAGVTIYRDPDWPGLTPDKAAPILSHLRPASAPESASAPCAPSPSSCARYSPVCVTNPTQDVTYRIVPESASRVKRCPGQGSYGMSHACVQNSWWNQFVDTGQYAADISVQEKQA